MRIAIVNESLPYPPHAGNRTRTLNLMLRLAGRHEITYICRAAESDEDTQAAVEFLKSSGIRTVIADSAPLPKQGPAFYARLAANLLSPLPYAVAAHNSRALRKAIRDLAVAREFDLWQFEWLAYADAVAGLPRVKTLVMAHNIESQIWQRYCETETSLARRTYFRNQWRKFQRYESRTFSKVTGVVCVSEQDAELALRGFSARRLWVVDNGIDRAYFQDSTAQRDPNCVLFLGSLEWRPNLEAVRLLLDRIFPAIQRRMPSARLSIVGRRPPQWLRDKINGSPCIQLHGDVPDVRTHLSSAAVMAVPLRVGGGSRLKILEAMACGLPVVSTPVGCEGLDLVAGQHIFVAQEADQFADAVVGTMRNLPTALAMADAGRRFVFERYDWDVLARKLEIAWEQAIRVSAGANHRSSLIEAQPALG